MKSIATIVAIILALIACIPYIRDTIVGKTKPHVISWFTWALVSFIAFGIQISNEGGIGSYVNLVMGIICFSTFLLGLKNGTRDITKFDIVAFILALIAIVLWLIVKQPLLSILLVVFIDIMSFLPTMRKSWNKPWSETLITWILGSVKNAFSIYALQAISLVTALFPVYSLITTLFFWIMLIVRRKVVKKEL